MDLYPRIRDRDGKLKLFVYSVWLFSLSPKISAAHLNPRVETLRVLSPPPIHYMTSLPNHTPFNSDIHFSASAFADEAD